MLNKIISLSKKFIAIKSTPENPKELGKILELALVNLKEYTIEKFEHNGVKSALIYNSKKRPKKFKLILNGHLDIIPGKENQYKPFVKGNRLYGVGSMDMKANVSCMILAFKEIANKVDYPLALQLVTDEEIGGFNGTKYQIEKGVRADFILAGEPTNFDIVNKAKGILWMKISSFGKTAHGAYPWRGENAIWKMSEFLGALKKMYPIPSEQKWITTVNLSNMETKNKVFNKIPDDCLISLDIRFTPEDSDLILKKIKKLLPKGFKLEIIAHEPALSTSKDDEFVKKLQEVSEKVIGKNIILREAQGSSDARHYAKINCPGIEFGPIGKGIGSDDEWVDVPSLLDFHNIIKEFLLSLNKR